MENRFFFFFFCSRSLFIVCVWSLALGKGLQMLTRRGSARGPDIRWGSLASEGELGSLASCALGASVFPGGTNLAGLQRLVGWPPHPGGGASGRHRDGDLCGQNPGHADPERSGSSPPGPWWHPVLVPLVWGRLGPQGSRGCCRCCCAGSASSEAAGPAHGRSGVGSPPGAHHGLESKPTERWVLETRPPVADHFLRWVE